QGQGRPFAEAIAILLHRFGGPVSMETLVTEIARIRRTEEDEIVDTVQRIVATDKNFVVTANNEVALTSWSFAASDELPERALALNSVTSEELAAAA
ncbi:hypothetical protein ABTA48_19405, partial [Acinetobacter baumannii]